MRRLLLFVTIGIFTASTVISIVSPSITSAAQPGCIIEDADGKCLDQYYIDQGIKRYDPREPSCQVGVGGSSSSLPEETIEYLDGRDVKTKLEQNKGRYLHAEQQSGIPWQITATLHYREAGLNAGSSIYNGAPLGSGTNVDGQEVVSDPNQDALNATLHFKGMAEGVYELDFTKIKEFTVDDWGKAFLAYNRGYLYERNGKQYHQSPYVMNGYDEDHMNMSWVGPPADPAVSGTDGNKAGALAFLSYIGGVSLGEVCSGGAVVGDVVKTAINYAREYDVPNGTTDPSEATQAYRDAMPEFNGHPAVYPQVTDCGRFVSTVLHASGADPEFPAVLTNVQADYMDSRPDKYQALGRIAYEDLMPGDILVTDSPGHIIIFTGPNGDYVAADASFYERVPSVRPAGNPMWMLSKGANVWRLQG